MKLAFVLLVLVFTITGETLRLKRQVCQHSLYLPLDNDIQDILNRHTVIAIGTVPTDDNVPSGYIGAGAATLGGTSRLHVPSFASLPSYGDEFAAKFRFHLAPVLGVAGKDIVLSNAASSGVGSIIVWYERFAKKMFAKVKSTVVAVSNVLPTGGWKSVIVKYNGAVVVLAVDGISASAPAVGVIPNTGKPLQVGGALTNENLRGFIDEVKIYHCLP